MPPTVLRRVVPALLALSALGGCAVGPDYRTPPVGPGEAQAWLTPVDTGEVDEAWWRALDDPLLAELVTAAVSGNKDLDEASARLREVRANRDAVRGRGGPQVGVTGGATQNRLSANGQLPVDSIPGFDPQFPIYDAGFDASWELDLWGATRRAVEAADARVGVVAEARRGVILQIIAETVRAYIDLRTAQSLRASTLADARAQEAVAGLVAERLRVGAASRLDLVRAQTQARATAAAIPGFDSDADAAAFRLALLVGQPPEALYARLRTPQNLPSTPVHVGVGLRSDLLLRRPDIRQAERDLAALTADIGVAKADLFPRITLLGSLSQQARASGDLFSNDSLRFQVGPALRWPIFSAGRIRAQVRAADARTDAAGARYERAVLAALADSETAINRFAAAGRTRAERDAARDDAAEAVTLARRRYQAGEDDLTVVLQAQSAFSVAERQSVQARASELQFLAALYKALGGGWAAVDGGAPSGA
ncbi:MAG: efflux transporter outer membrane subunit [Alphaproteobacteria bacterium]|nr:efflux transporter outer membrane subunit [Alphaproteobacteria bacterium]MBU1516610.1 efflux transporter outer membrane subunit [Alphaproteobacteria bacterium]MBU2094366.1 efflux transporter outer membrane subunit [Alphaproteobacteria bacterium]MBU2153251.1 efflux transporter outer membrane subunit [Alphaproteobacteria bacterium]MBU2307537.1 efflux transporter outer membrane subunit [Alphaproteobacteria bacterium]